MTTAPRAARRDTLVAAGGSPASVAGDGAWRDEAPTGPIRTHPDEPRAASRAASRAGSRAERRRRRGALPVVLMVLAAVVFAGTGTYVFTRSDAVPALSAAPAIATPVVPGAAPVTGADAPSSPAVPVAATSPMEASPPQQVRIPSIGSQSMLMTLGLNPDRTVEVPPLERSEVAGWYRHSPTPGEAGTSAILGHIDGGGKEGVFFRLQQMQTGQKVYVDRGDGVTAEFTVTEVQNFAKDAFPTERVYGQTPDAQLRLISCGGALDRAVGSYEDNVVVFATLTGTART